MKKIFGLIVFTIITGMVFGIVALNQAFQFWLRMPPKDAQEMSFEIEKGESVNAISDRLLENDLISNLFWFKVFLKIDGTARGIHAGSFTLKKGMNYKSIIDELSFAASEEISITFPEGRTSTEYAEIVTELFDITEDEWIATAKPFEGFLFPDTYRFFPDATAEEIVNEMRDTFNEKLEDAGLEISMDDLIIASILEKEVKRPDEMRLVAGVIYNRIEIGMPLQVDATLFYVLPFGQFDSSIDSPYNSYKYTGLPPGPIGNPGIAAIESAQNPTPSSYLFYVTRPEDDVAVFAETYGEHSANVQKYLR